MRLLRLYLPVGSSPMRSHQLDDKRDCFSGILRHEAPAGRQNERYYFSAWKEDSFLVEVVCRRVHVCGHVQSCSCTIVSCKLTETRVACCTCIGGRLSGCVEEYVLYRGALKCVADPFASLFLALSTRFPPLLSYLKC